MKKKKERRKLRKESKKELEEEIEKELQDLPNEIKFVIADATIEAIRSYSLTDFVFPEKVLKRMKKLKLLESRYSKHGNSYQFTGKIITTFSKTIKTKLGLLKRTTF